MAPKEGRATVWYTKAAQRFADATQKIIRHNDQELPEVVAALPVNFENSSFYNQKNYLNQDVKAAFTRPSELYQRVEALEAGKVKKRGPGRHTV
ncbi:MAG: hypothetical protein HY051_00815 [Candidatus Aenigmarchaeota archaeon]|nr:hypothetical protein [Candidatus Aenigmarchaeota archaeon]